MAAIPNPLDLLREQVDELKIQGEDLDELVHEMKAQEASDINNDGIDTQLEALFCAYGYDETKKMLDDLMAGVPE
jgi:hypothetical protein